MEFKILDNKISPNRSHTITGKTGKKKVSRKREKEFQSS